MISRWLGMLLVAASCLGGALPAASAAVAAVQVTPLMPGVDTVPLPRQAQLLVPRSSVTIVQMAAGRLDGQLEAPDAAVFPLSGDNELWIPIRLQNQSRQTAAWQLQVAQPSIDEVTLFDARGQRWTESAAGDRIERSSWPRPGRFPCFDLQFEPGETRTLFLRVRSAIPSPVPLRVMTQSAADAADQEADIAFGFVLGALALLVGACLVQAAVYRDIAYFLYGSYALLLGIAFAALSGFAGPLLWGDYPEWNDTAKSVFPLAAAGVSVWLVRALCRVGTRAKTLSAVSAVLGTLVIGIAIVFAILRTFNPAVMALGMLTAATTVLVIALSTWKRGDA
ncbi:MAG: 7TM-DISM domain-containing protein, partial [Ramlibacter sp.]